MEKCCCSIVLFLFDEKINFNELAWFGDPFLQCLLQAPHVQRFTGHADQCHYFQKLFFDSLAKLLDVIATFKKQK